MIPLGDSESSRRLPPVNTLLVAANLGVFALELQLGTVAGRELARFAMIPARVSSPHPPLTELAVLATLVTSTFLHAGWLHVGGNMLYLLIFGPAVEHRLGHLRYLAFYLIAGIVASMATVTMAPASEVAVVGASGAIAGVLGAYLILFPAARITTVVPVRMVRIPAVFYLILWFGLQLYAGLSQEAAAPLVGGVAWWAHVGGFLFGVAAAPIVATRRPAAPRRNASRNRKVGSLKAARSR
jgi:membrane associated rhomboid family serine protease